MRQFQALRGYPFFAWSIEIGAPTPSVSVSHFCHRVGATKEWCRDITGLLIFLAIGAVAGWLASTLMKGGGFGLLGNIIVGVIGVVIGGFLFGLLGIGAGGLIGPIITATASAAILLFIVGLIKK